MTFEEELEFVVNCAEAGIDEYSCGDEYKKEMSRVEEFMKRCLDKQRVREAIDSVINHGNKREKTIEKAILKKLRL